MKKILAVIGVLFVLTGAYFTFRGGPPLSDEAMIAQNMEEAEAALEARSAARLTKFLAPEFRAGDMGRKDVNTSLAGTFWQWRDVQLTRSGESIAIKGESATVSGTYTLRYRPSESEAPATQRGTYTLQLRRMDGEWKVTDASGTDLPR